MRAMTVGIVFLAVPVVVGMAAGLFLAMLYEGSSAADIMYGPSDDDMYAGPDMQQQQVDISTGNELYASQLVRGGLPALGDTSAGITMVEWGDYQCTYCYLFHNETLNQIKDTYVDSGEVRIIFRDFALNGPDSVLAAAASRCADDQSGYWKYHDITYQNWRGERTGWVTHDALASFAAAAGLDVSEFKKCQESGTYTQDVYDEYAAGQRIGIDATPSFLIFNETHAIKIRGNQPPEVFVDAIEQLRAGA